MSKAVKKPDIYINLHPDYSYATAMLNNFVEVREWIKLIDWLSWGVNKRELHITGGYGNEVGSHIAKGYVKAFSQLMSDMGVTMQIRNGRSDEWQWVVIEDRLPEDRYLEILYDTWHKDDTADWLKEKVKKNLALADMAEKEGMEEAKERFIKEADECLERLNKMMEAEVKRQKRIFYLVTGREV